MSDKDRIFVPFVIEFGAINRFSSCSVGIGEVSTLDFPPQTKQGSVGNDVKSGIDCSLGVEEE